MKQNLKTATFLLICTLAVSFFIAMAPAQAGRESEVTFFIRNMKKKVPAIDTNYASAEDLAGLFSASVVTLDGGKAIRVGHVYYDYRIRPYNGKAYVDVEPFLKHFELSYKKTGTQNYSTSERRIPILTTIYTKPAPKAQVTFTRNGKQVEMDMLKIKTKDFVDLEEFASNVRARYNVDKTTGRAEINSKPISLWLEYNGKVYALVDDLEKATNQNVKY
ncbi:MAG: hypothetical protein ACLFQV_12345 [Vulcanimicrobiota bacterium]